MVETHAGKYLTSPLLTKFELARVLGMRILQLTDLGVCADDPKQVALREILAGTNPVIVRRKLPDGRHEDRPVSELRLGADLRRLCEEL